MIRDDLHQACRTDSGMIDGGSWESGKEERESRGVGTIQYKSRLFKKSSDTAATTVSLLGPTVFRGPRDAAKFGFPRYLSREIYRGFSADFVFSRGI